MNGDVSSPDALIRNLGPDEISLREALFAANNIPGPHVIVFSTGLAGSTVALGGSLPTIVRDGITITGIGTADGYPTITIDRTGLGAWCAAFIVSASDFSLAQIRITRTP